MSEPMSSEETTALRQLTSERGMYEMARDRELKANRGDTCSERVLDFERRILELSQRINEFN